MPNSLRLSNRSRRYSPLLVMNPEPSERNFAGKSSIIEMILWCLRGTPKGLQGDVRKWLSWIALDFLVDAQPYRIEFAVEAGLSTGTLLLIRPVGAPTVVDRFSSDEGFAAAMSQFIMNTLDLDPIPAMQGQEGDKMAVEHGWTALSGGLYFGGDHKLLLGDVQMGGLPARILQMYVGLPWALTVMQARTVKKEVEQEQEQSNNAAIKAATEAAKARTRLDTDLAAAHKKLAGLSSTQATAEELERLAGEVAWLSPLAIDQATFSATLSTSRARSAVVTDTASLSNRRGASHNRNKPNQKSTTMKLNHSSGAY